MLVHLFIKSNFNNQLNVSSETNNKFVKIILNNMEIKFLFKKS